MAKKRRGITVSGVISAILGLMCALVLAVLFYGTMVYQLAGGQGDAADEAQGGVLALTQGTLVGEQVLRQQVGGALCSVLERTYQLEDGQTARAVTASPAAYLEVLAGEGVTMQLITGFVIDDLDAVYALSGGAGILAARSGDAVYLIEAALEQQALYALGATARREQQ